MIVVRVFISRNEEARYFRTIERLDLNTVPDFGTKALQEFQARTLVTFHGNTFGQSGFLAKPDLFAGYMSLAKARGNYL